MATEVINLAMDRPDFPRVRRGRVGDEIGVSGLPYAFGRVEAADFSDVLWPQVYKLYNALWRRQPEVVIVRRAFDHWGKGIDLLWSLPENASDEAKRRRDFLEEIFLDLDGGPRSLIDPMVTKVPFFGFGLWEFVAGLRRRGWRPPDPADRWRSKFNDNRLGIRRIAWRDHSSFVRWYFDDNDRYLLGYQQQKYLGGFIDIPAARLLHLRHGDESNPEGFTPLEYIYRMDTDLRAYKFIHGTGAEKSAGLAVFGVDGTPTDSDEELISQSARAALTAQEGNYIVETDRVKFRLESSTFAAGTTLMQAIQYYSTKILQAYNMDWVTMATSGDAGAFAAVAARIRDSVESFNSMTSGFAERAGEQITDYLFGAGDRLRDFRPEDNVVLTATQAKAPISLSELATFVQAVWPQLAIGERDVIDLRRASGFMAEDIPTDDEIISPAVDQVDEPAPVPEPAAPAGPTDEELDEEMVADVEAELEAFYQWSGLVSRGDLVVDNGTGTVAVGPRTMAEFGLEPQPNLWSDPDEEEDDD